MKVEMKNVKISGTYKVGEFNDVYYNQLVKVFGEPNGCGDGYKVDAEWVGTIDGEIFSIYNYKNGKNYGGVDGLELSQINEWSIGGRSTTTAGKLINYFNAKTRGDKSYRAVITIQLEYTIKAQDRSEVNDFVENVELPNNYVEDSFEVVKIEEVK